MGVPISNVTRRVVYAASGTGPYAFTFEILAAGDIAVYRDDTLLTITTDYTVTINSNGTGSITLTASPTGATQIAIVGNRTISRTTDFVTGGDFFANTLNDELDQQTIFNQQNQEGLQRALQAPQTDPTSISMTLPRAALRANKVLSFDANGNPSATEFIGSNRGNWAAATLYYVRDIVKDTTNDNIYQCIDQHTSSGSLPISTNAASAKWALLVDAAQAFSYATAAAASASAASSSASAASTSATNASNSASAASTSATNAASSASSASTSASNASTSASNASSSASTASTAATNAGNSATAAASSASTASTAATNASNSASSASTSASNASTSATNASNSASTATTQATNASNSASAASTSATNASNSATAAQSAQTAAEAAYDNFDDRYLGAKSANPTVDNDGNALITGALYFNTAVPEMRVYTGSAWVPVSTTPDTIVEVEFTATAGQTSYTFSGGYRVGFTYVWVNGVMLSDSDITASDGSTITFGTALALNDEVRVITFKAIGSVTISDISGLQTALDAKQDDVTVNGIVKGNGSGTLSAAVAGTDYLAPAAIGTTVQAYDSNLTSFVSTFTLPTTDGTNGQVLSTNGSGTLSWATGGGGGTSITISNDTSTSSALYPAFFAATSGTASTVYTSNAKLLYKPSNGELQSSAIYANNGVIAHANVVSASYTVPTNANVMTVGPWTVGSGATFTLPAGSRQVLL